MSLSTRRVAWIALLAVVLGGLLFVSFGERPGETTPAARAASIAEGVRCPTCRGQSVADSAAPAATAIRDEINRRVAAGEGRTEVEAYLVGRYGEDILLTPPDRGLGSIVWVLPVVLLGAGGAGLWVALRRWSRRSLAVPTDVDRAIVDRAARQAAP